MTLRSKLELWLLALSALCAIAGYLSSSVTPGGQELECRRIK